MGYHNGYLAYIKMFFERLYRLSLYLTQNYRIIIGFIGLAMSSEWVMGVYVIHTFVFL